MNLSNGKTGAHATAMYFHGKRQVFFDPSHVMKKIRDRTGVTVWDYMKSHHMWMAAEANPVLSIVDEDMEPNRNLQRTFGSLDYNNRDAPDKTFRRGNEIDPKELRECCAPVVILVVFLCLRFGCRDPQWMVHAMRYGMESARTSIRQSIDPSTHHVFETFLYKFQAWHLALSDPYLSWKDEFLSLLGIRVEPGSSSVP